jgi:hypothetical protein
MHGASFKKIKKKASRGLRSGDVGDRFYGKL